MKTYLVCMGCLAVALGCAVVQADQDDQMTLPLQIGDTEDVQIESPQPYPPGQTGMEVVWTQTLHREGATFVRVHFSDDSALGGVNDTVIVRDADGRVIDSFTEADIAGAWTGAAAGSTVTVELLADADGGGAGVTIELMVWGTAPLHGSAGARSYYTDICSADVQSRIRTADPVATISWADDCGGYYLCTGWLFSPEGHFMTNAHCANSVSESNSMLIDFNYMSYSCDLPGEPNPDTYDNNSFDSMVCDLDMAIHLAYDNTKGNPVDVYGYLPINTARPPTGTELWLPQHPGGARKKIAENCEVTANNLAGQDNCQDPDVGCDYGGHFVSGVALRYDCETDHGSSGSPVLNTDDQVVGITNMGLETGGQTSFGVKMESIAPYLPDMPVRLEMSGPPTMAEETTVHIYAIAWYLLDGWANVNNDAVWEVYPSEAGICINGDFTAEEVATNTVVTITATYTEDSHPPVQNSIQITVIDMNPQAIDVTLEASVDPNDVCPGQTFDVTLKLATTNGPEQDIRLLQFAAAMSSNLAVNSVTWDLQLTSPALYNLSDIDENDVFAAAYVGTARVPGYIVDLDSTPQTVAQLNVTYLGGGTALLNVLGDMALEPDFAVWLRSGFDPVVDFLQSAGKVQGGTLAFNEGACETLHIVGSDPVDGSIDARIPSEPDGSGEYGWQYVDVTFDQVPTSAPSPSDFVIEEICNVGECDDTPPALTMIDWDGMSATVQLQFGSPISQKAWTKISLVGGDPTDVIRLGYLPADADNSRTANANDITEVVDLVNEAGGGGSPPEYRGDIDRSGAITANDITVVIDLLNGGGSYEAYINKSLPAMP